MTAFRFPWKKLTSCGSDDSISDGRGMKQKKQIKGVLPITALFVDVGGVLLTDGWGHGSRELAAKAFDLDPEEMENRHSQAFGTYELGKLTIEEYLSRVVFYVERPFTPAQFQKFMFAQSKPYPRDDRVGPQAQGKVWA